MTPNQVYLEKARLTTAQLQAEGGFLSPAQATEFVRQMFDATVLAAELRRVLMRAPEQEINKIFVGARLTRGVSPENQDMSTFGRTPTMTTITLSAKKYGLFYEISEDAIEDNIAGDQLERTVAEHFANQFGLDLEDLAINGDLLTVLPSTTLSAGINALVTTIPVISTVGFPDDSSAGFLVIGLEYIGYGSRNTLNFFNAIRGDGPIDNPTIAAAHLIAAAVTWSPHPLTGFDDGYLKLASNGGVLYDASVVNSGNLTKNHFYDMLRALPNQYKRGGAKGQLRWIMSMSQYINWQEYLADKNANTGYDVLNGTEFMPLGIPAIAAHSMPDSKIVLTYPNNFVWGVWRQIRVRKAAMDRFAIATDTRAYAANIRCDFEIERRDAVVLGKGFSGAV